MGSSWWLNSETRVDTQLAEVCILTRPRDEDSICVNSRTALVLLVLNAFFLTSRQHLSSRN
jgi:hypothetical protein